MPPAAASRKASASRHKGRSSVALRPSLYKIVKQHADEQRRPISWEVQDILLEVLVARGVITSEKKKELWADVVNKILGGTK